MRLLWRLERRGSRCSRGGDGLTVCAVDTAGVFCSWILEGLDGNIENRSTRQRLTWLLSVFRHEDFGTVCTIQYPLTNVHKPGLGSGRTSEGDLAATKWSFLRERTDEVELYCFFNTSH